MNTQPIEIKPVSGSGDIKAFIEFPKRLYRGCGQFVPLFDIDMRVLLKKRHPFFLHSDGDFLLVRRGAEVVGRCLVTENRRYNDFHGTNWIIRTTLSHRSGYSEPPLRAT
ncbi:MAG: hypothetical protein SVR04_10170 [Spirochaetota bacterium]|nr:hypothetical protein [Spirochaetota bacterium]